MRRIVALFMILVTVSLCSCARTPEKVGGLEVYCFSAGKADAFLLSTKESAVLIDTGLNGFGAEVLGVMKEKGISKLDCMIITHFDKDHVGGASEIINGCAVENVLQSNYEKNSDEYRKYVKALSEKKLEANTLREKYVFTLDEAEYTVVPPEEEVYEKNPSNNSSLIVSVKYGRNSFLFMGDAQKQRVKEFINQNTKTYDFIKVPHHGKWQGKLDDLFAVTKPTYAVITSSDTDREDVMTLDVLKRAGTKTFLTRLEPVLVKRDGKKITADYV